MIRTSKPLESRRGECPPTARKRSAALGHPSGADVVLQRLANAGVEGGGFVLVQHALPDPVRTHRSVLGAVCLPLFEAIVVRDGRPVIRKNQSVPAFGNCSLDDNIGNGDLNNQGTHQLDVAQWAIDEDQTHPVRAMALGGRFKWDDQGETPNSMFGIAEYPNGQSVFFNVRNVNYSGYKRQVMNEFYFEDGGWMDDGGTYYKKGSTKGERINFPSVEITGEAASRILAVLMAGGFTWIEEKPDAVY